MKSKSRTFKTFAILSYIGNILIGLVLLFFLVGCIINGAKLMKSISMDSVFGGLVGIFALASAILLASCITSMVGVRKMRKGKRSGFLTYLVSNGIWILLLLYGASGGQIWLLLMGIVSLVFVGYFALQLPKLS